MPCGIICGRITPARGNLEHRPLSGAVQLCVVLLFVKIILFSKDWVSLSFTHLVKLSVAPHRGWNMTGKQKYLNVKYLCLFFLLKADDKILDQHLIPYRHNTTAPAATSAGAFDRS